MNTRTWKRIGASGFWALGLALLAGACGGTTANSPGLGSESHFLARCEGSCPGGLDCIGGICTRACLTASSSCEDLGSGARCTDQSVEPGEVAVCDVGCSTSADCSALGTDYTCEDAFCRAGGTAQNPGGTPSNPDDTPSNPGALSCTDYADQSPPPDLRGITIVNRSSQVLYLQQFGICGGDNEYSLVQVLRDGVLVNTTGGGCGVSCNETLSSGWPRSFTYPCATGECVGELNPDCPGIDCPAPARVAIQPGDSVFQPGKLETVFQGMPASCVTAPPPSGQPAVNTVNCYTKVIPQRGNYRLNVRAFTEAECATLDCPPAVEVSQPTDWYFQNLFIDLTLPE